MSVALCLAVLGSFCLAVAINCALPTVLHRLGLHDRQNDRSSHTGDVLRGGGVGFVIAASAASGVALVIGGLMRQEALAVLGAALVIAAIGLIDDGVGLSPVIRLAVHLALSLLAAATILHGSSWPVVALAALAVAWSTNLTNFMDGIDGLAATQGAFVLGALGGFACIGGDGALAVPALAGAAALLAFLPWNLTPARMFMGDVGSGWIGFLIGALCVWAVADGVMSLWTALLLDALFIADATVTLLARAIAGERVWAAHRTHAYQLLSDRWKGHVRVTAAFASVNLGVILPLAIISEATPAAAPWMAGIALLTLGVGALVARALLPKGSPRST